MAVSDKNTFNILYFKYKYYTLNYIPVKKPHITSFTNKKNPFDFTFNNNNQYPDTCFHKIGYENVIITMSCPVGFTISTDGGIE